jgi:hypothetical protein
VLVHGDLREGDGGDHVVVNNADRGGSWRGVDAGYGDHGRVRHIEHKLRTVLWGYGQLMAPTYRSPRRH